MTGTKVNIVLGQTVSSYDTAGHRWEQSQVRGDLLGSSWLPLSDGRLLRSGGLSQESGQFSSSCSVFTGALGGKPLSLGGLSQPRQGHSLAQFRGRVFAAGGNCRRRSSGQRQAGRIFVEYYVPGTDLWHPLPVQPPLSSSSLVLALLVVNTPLRSLHLQNQQQQANNNNSINNTDLLNKA